MVCEVALALQLHGIGVDLVMDVGVAGLHRLLDQLPRLETARVLIACAGMEGALPTVLAGLVPQPVIGVPVSVGYGVSQGDALPWMECSPAAPLGYASSTSTTATARLWLPCGCFALAETLQLGVMGQPFHSQQCRDQGMAISSGELTILLPFHGARIRSHPS